MGHCLLCGASREAQPGRVFHTFPEEPSRRRLWLLYCGRDAEPEPRGALFLCATCCSPQLLNTAGVVGPPPPQPLHGSVEPGAGMQSPREPLVPLFANHPAGDGPATELAADRAEAVLAPWAMPAPLVSIIECSDTVSTEPLEVKPKVEYLAGDPVNSASSPTLPTGAEAPEHPVESSGAASGQEAAGARIRCKPLEQLVSHSPTAGTAPEAAWRAPAPLPPPGFYPTSVPAREFNHLSAYGYHEQVPQQSVEPGAGMQSPREPLVPLFANHPAGDGPATELAADRAEAVLAPWAMPAPLVSIIECSDTVSTEPLEVKPKVEYLAGDPVNSASSPTLPTGAEAPEHPVESSGAASGQEAAGARIRCKPLEQLVSHSPTAGTAPTAPEAAWRVPAPLPPPGFYPTSVPAQEFNHLSAYGYREQVPQPGPRPSAHELNTAEVASLREKVRQLEWDLELRDMKIADLKTHVEELNRLVGSTCTDLNHISVRESVPLAGRVLLRLLAGHKDRGGPVNPILQTFAIKMYSQSPAVYRYVRQTFGGTMPTENNVVAWKKLADRLKQLK